MGHICLKSGYYNKRKVIKMKMKLKMKMEMEIKKKEIEEGWGILIL